MGVVYFLYQLRKERMIALLNTFLYYYILIGSMIAIIKLLRFNNPVKFALIKEKTGIDFNQFTFFQGFVVIGFLFFVSVLISPLVYTIVCLKWVFKG